MKVRSISITVLGLAYSVGSASVHALDLESSFIEEIGQQSRRLDKVRKGDECRNGKSYGTCKMCDGSKKLPVSVYQYTHINNPPEHPPASSSSSSSSGSSSKSSKSGSYKNGGSSSYKNGKGSYKSGGGSYKNGKGSYKSGGGSADWGSGGSKYKSGGGDSYKSGKGSYKSGGGSGDWGSGSSKYKSGGGSYKNGKSGAYKNGGGSGDWGSGGSKYKSGGGGGQWHGSRRDLNQNDVERDLGDSMEMNCIPDCPDGYKLCLQRRPRKDGAKDHDGQPKFYIEYDAARCIPKDGNCSLCTPGRYCKSEMRCIQSNKHYDCAAWW